MSQSPSPPPEPQPETIVTHLAENPGQHLGAVVPPIFQNSLFTFPTFAAFRDAMQGQAQEPGFVYTRVGNPTTAVLEAKIAALESSGPGKYSARAFASGMGAITAAILNSVQQGSHVVAEQTIYGPTRTFLNEYLPRLGVETSFVDGRQLANFEAAIRPGTSLIYLESPSSMVFHLQDLAAVAELASSRGIRTVIDNSWASPLYQKPLELGIDICVYTATKYFGGHSDVVAGMLAGRPGLVETIQHREAELLGAVLDPFAAWLLIRGLRTLPTRLAQVSSHALEVAHFLESHPGVEAVVHPGLESHPQHALAEQQMSGYGGLFSVRIKGGLPAVQRFCDALEIFQMGVSWGGHESLAVPAAASQDHFSEADRAKGVFPGLVRLYTGLESAADLTRDLDQALAAAAG